ncbi:MAG: Adenosylcobinamide-GDP ribazoletransferase [Syntrophus sp. SKADARSKE-3]|nr:Adenosylcobinamide-GDP ribazoletransferase [Syntrophus sp. SKADARSKE-3]
MKAFFAALQFLTIIPVPSLLTGDEKTLSESVPYFPVVGLLIGLGIAGLDLCLSSLLPSVVTAWCAVLLLIAVTGGLHMDGLADTADGFFSARNRERMLEIMRDSRIGAMGVLAIIFAVGLKVAALSSLASPERMAILILMPLAGRSAIVLMITVLPYARCDGGLASIFLVRRTRFTPIAALILLFGAAWGLGQSLGLAAFAMISAGLIIFYTFKKIGGFTGDTLGAVSELTEVAVVLAAAAWTHVLRS